MTDAAATYPGIADTRRIEQNRARRHTRRVKRLRVLLPIVSGIIVLGLAGAAIIPKLVPLSMLAGLSLTSDGLVMNEPRLSGHLGEGRRYEVVAERAVQSLLTPSRLSLEALNVNLDMGDGQTVNIHGDIAKYDTGTEILELSEGVSINSSDGNHAKLDNATVHLSEGRVEGEGGIDIDSPRGRIRAGRIDVTDGGGLIRFTGGVSITINPAP
ncbi:LPS export ABC transporter periplasmic protein LptC [Acuticoccus sp. M5D2P5]|uniref:LPS export ABC transporter periplasmic protein LptC n=1 Tax=Acuticoccus kalidii TaxID=2910977 RepID=UPI001F2C732A|nr:LPS export ABC transporter periplasmic protein LptC [Acuticoccus kalidii]MCF3932300.1 LPS export ABC transporter periplasmic protein LptC [Acuticoccus kalidii]